MEETDDLKVKSPTFENVLEQLGPFRRFQLTQVCLGIMGLGITSLMTLSFVFLGHEPPHVCNKINESQYLINHGYLNETSTKFSYKSCDIRISTNQNGTEHDITRMSCPNGRNFSGAKHTTLLSEWDLVCESKGQAEISYTAFTAGQIAGGVSASLMADRFGRKPVFMAAALSAFLFEAIATFSVNIYMIIALRFFSGISRQSFSEVFYIHGVEFLLPKQRQVYGVVVCMLWVSYLLVLGGIAYVLQDFNWRYTQGIVAAFGVFSLLYPFIIVESPRWLVTKNRYDEALHILKKGCKQNNVDFEKLRAVFEAYKKHESVKRNKENLLLTAESINDDNLQMAISEVNVEIRPQDSIFSLLRYKETRVVLLIACYTWITHSMTYYGLFMTSSKLAGNRFLNYSIMAFVEIPSNPLILYMMNRFSRRTVLNIFLGLAALSLFLSSILAIFEDSFEHSGTVFTTLFILGKFFITSSYNMVYIWAPEIFPTSVRSTACATATCAARISSLAVAYLRPLISVITWGPGMIFTIFCIINLFLTYFLPETKGKQLCNSIVEMRNSYKRRTKKSAAKEGV